MAYNLNLVSAVVGLGVHISGLNADFSSSFAVCGETMGIPSSLTHIN